MEELSAVKKDRQKDLDQKNSELTSIVSESESEEAKLNNDREKATKKVDERLLKSYTKIRANAKNGLAVVLVKEVHAADVSTQFPHKDKLIFVRRKS